MAGERARRKPRLRDMLFSKYAALQHTPLSGRAQRGTLLFENTSQKGGFALQYRQKIRVSGV